MVRILSGVVLAAVFLALIWFGNAIVLLIAALAVAALAVHEFVQLFRALGAHAPALPALLATWAATVAVPFPNVAVETTISAALIFVAAWAMAVISDQPGRGFAEAALGTSAALLAPVYIGFGLGSLVAVHARGGRGAVLLVMATIVVSDTAQYFTGRAVGKHPLAVRVSPNKTIEGALGGLVVATVFFVWAATYLLPAAVTGLTLAFVGAAIVVAGIAGDLFESTLKRAAGMKDSSALIPGHGGVLDRIDAMLFGAPVFYIYLRLLLS
jgi:phosphatidate cytidylyltransferase